MIFTDVESMGLYVIYEANIRETTQKSNGFSNCGRRTLTGVQIIIHRY